MNSPTDLVGLGLRNPGLASAILATAPARYAPRHEMVDGLVYCPVDKVHLPPTQPAPAPVRCRICGPVSIDDSGATGIEWTVLLAVMGIIAAVIVPVIVVLTGHTEPPSTDPRGGRVWVEQAQTWKICDGTTLLYGPGTREQSAIANSPECAR